jgi:hypothetical protein
LFKPEIHLKDIPEYEPLKSGIMCIDLASMGTYGIGERLGREPGDNLIVIKGVGHT